METTSGVGTSSNKEGPFTILGAIASVGALLLAFVTQPWPWPVRLVLGGLLLGGAGGGVLGFAYGRARSSSLGGLQRRVLWASGTVTVLAGLTFLFVPISLPSGAAGAQANPAPTLDRSAPIASPSPVTSASSSPASTTAATASSGPLPAGVPPGRATLAEGVTLSAVDFDRNASPPVVRLLVSNQARRSFNLQFTGSDVTLTDDVGSRYDRYITSVSETVNSGLTTSFEVELRSQLSPNAKYLIVKIVSISGVANVAVSFRLP